MPEKLLAWLRLTRRPALQLYRGFGSPTRVVVQGTAFRHSPLPTGSSRAGFGATAWRLVRLFRVRPWADAPVRVRVGGQVAGGRTDADGFFRFEVELPAALRPGWHPVEADLLDPRSGVSLAQSAAEVLIAADTSCAFISDIDDTILVSHSATRWRRLWVLLSREAHRRQAFAGVAAHYQWLARAGAAPPGLDNPFFYVSSSEWNLYDYLLAFTAHNGLPKGVFLLSQLKRLRQLGQSGPLKHATKLDRIARILEAFPGQRFGLLGDDAQQDPAIYAAVVRRFPTRVRVVYLRRAPHGDRAAAEAALTEISRAGVATCYFTHSREALQHSQLMGL